MTLRTGIDLLEIYRLEEALERHGERFLARIYTQAERELCAGNPASLAARFAAKEAVAKALGTGLGVVAWREIEILNEKSGRPKVILPKKIVLKTFDLSISHTDSFAIAFFAAVI